MLNNLNPNQRYLKSFEEKDLACHQDEQGPIPDREGSLQRDQEGARTQQQQENSHRTIHTSPAPNNSSASTGSPTKDRRTAFVKQASLENQIHLSL